MVFFLPLIAAVLQASSFTLDKIVLSFRGINFKAYTGTSFPISFLITSVLFFIFRPPLSWALFQGNLFWLLLASIGMTIATNLIFYRALQDDRLQEIQTFELLPGLSVILFSTIFFIDERNFAVLIPALIAALAVIWSHWEKHHIHIAKHTLPFILWSLAAAPFATSISKILLASWNPIALEMIRSGITTAILVPLFTKYTEHIPFRAILLFYLTNILTSIAWILFYFSFQKSGIVYTLLIFSIQPLLVYFASIFFLKEELQWKKVVAFVVVLISIATAHVLREM